MIIGIIGLGVVGSANRYGFKKIGHKVLVHDIKLKTKIENLDVITSGPVPPNPSELLINSATEELINSLKEEYDYIIDLHHNLRTLRIKRFLKNVRSFSFSKLNVEKFILTNLKINTLPNAFGTEYVILFILYACSAFEPVFNWHL